ncbi:MAG: hypothetical protein ACKO04_17195 [Actinomycetes bacterium]
MGDVTGDEQSANEPADVPTDAEADAPTDTEAGAPVRQRNVGRIAATVLLALLGSWVGVRILAHTTVETSVGEATLSVQPSFRGITRLSVAPLGSVIGRTHTAPVMVDARLTALDQNLVLRQAESFQDKGALAPEIDTSQLADQLGSALWPLALRTVLGAVLGAALLVLLVMRTRRLVLLAGGVGLVASVAALALTAATNDGTAWRDPERKGLVALAPELVNQVESKDTTEAREYFARTIRNLQGIYRGYVGTARTLQAIKGTQRVAVVSLHVAPLQADQLDSGADVDVTEEDVDETGETTTSLVGDVTTTTSTTVPPVPVGAPSVDPNSLRTFASLTTDQAVVAAVLYLDGPTSAITPWVLTDAGMEAVAVVVGTDGVKVVTPARLTTPIALTEEVPGLVFKIGQLRVSVLDPARPRVVPDATSVLVVPEGLEAPEDVSVSSVRPGRSLRSRGRVTPAVVVPESTRTNLRAATLAVNPTTGAAPLVNLMTVGPAGVDVETVTP